MTRTRRMTGIYPDRRKMGLRSLENSEVPRASKDTILSFVERIRADGLSPAREAFYLTHLKGLAAILGEAFLNPTRRDVERALAEVESRDLEAWTKVNYRTSLKRFYKWLLGNDEAYPEVVRWVRVKPRNGNGLRTKRPGDLLTAEDVEALVRACQNERDRAFISLLADSGCRIGEILTLRIGDVAFDQYGLVLSATGKTGERRVRVIGDSIAYVAGWLNVHPTPGDSEAPLFVGLDERTRDRGMNYAQARKVLLSKAARAGLKKRVHPHLFRHSKATQLASKVPEAPLEAQMGWVPGSAMSRVYVHLSGRDVDAAMLKAHGIRVPEAKEIESATRTCPRCQVQNARALRFCRRCGLPMDIEAAFRVEAQVAREDERQREIDLNPDLRTVRDEIARLQRELERLARASAA